MDEHYDHVVYLSDHCVFFTVSLWSLSPCYKNRVSKGQDILGKYVTILLEESNGLLIFKTILAHKLKLVLGSLTGLSFCLKVKSKTDCFLILPIWIDSLGRRAIMKKTSQKQELSINLKNSINKLKVSMNVSKVHVWYLEGRNVCGRNFYRICLWESIMQVYRVSIYGVTFKI